MKIIPFITVHGATDALALYQEVFRAKEVGNRTMLSSIEGFENPKFEDKVGHMTVQVGDSTFYMNDFLYEYPVDFGNHVQFVVELEDETRLRTAFFKLADGGEIISEIRPVFWGALFGTVKDRFGVTWQVYCNLK